MRGAIYARMSTDKQSSDSPADQITRCRAFAAQRGWTVVEALVVSEAGISGASRHNRPGLLSLVDRIAEWDVLLCWDSSRLARDSEDLGWIRNRLRARRRTGFEVSTGLDLFNVGAKVLGVMAEEYLVKLRADTQRGLRGRAERGLSTGGLAYGYRSEPVAIDEHGRAVESAGFRVVVDDAPADVVRRIFDLYRDGAGLREIAHRLNAERVAPPRPRALAGRPASWAPSAIREMLRNPLYAGERIFNRTEWVKDHETGRRRRYERSPDEWVREDRPDLAIVSRATFEAVQTESRRRALVAPYTRKANGADFAGNRKGGSGPARHVLSGFLECGCCGGGFHALNSAGRYGCGWHRGRGPVVCSSTLTVPRTALEERIFGALEDRILVPENVVYAVEQALAIAGRIAQSMPVDPATEARLAELETEIETLRRLAGRHRSRTEPLLAELEAERAALLARDAPLELDLESLRPRIEARARALRGAFRGPDDARRALLRSLLRDRRMRVLSDEEQRFRVEALFELDLETADARNLQGSGRLHSQVAGVRNAPRYRRPALEIAAPLCAAGPW